jgi:hypothetical protein
MEENKKVEFNGKIAKMPKNTKASKAYNFLENVHISKRKLWYFIIEQEMIKENNVYQEVQLIKYNNKRGVDCTKFVEELKKFYNKNQQLAPFIEKLQVEGEDKFSIIRNIPKIEIEGKKFISIIMEDLMKLLSNDNTKASEDESEE